MMRMMMNNNVNVNANSHRDLTNGGTGLGLDPLVDANACLMCGIASRPLTRRDHWKVGRYCNACGLRVRAEVHKRLGHPYFPKKVKAFVDRFPKIIRYFDPTVFGLRNVPVRAPVRPRCRHGCSKIAPRKRNVKAWCADCDALLGKHSRRGSECHLCNRCGLREQRQLRADEYGLGLARLFEYACPDVSGVFLRDDIQNWLSFYR